MVDPTRDDGWLADPRFAPLFDALLATVVKQYRVEAPAARALLAEALASAPLRLLVAKAASPADIRRTRVFKDAVAAAKRHVYHELRRYRPGDEVDHDALVAKLCDGDAVLSAADLAAIVDQLSDGHASTRERKADEAAFYAFLVRTLGDAASILDVGCGVQPLRFPFASFPRLRCYAAVDSNEQSVDAVAAFAAATKNGVLRAVRDNLSDGWKAILAQVNLDGRAAFDGALILKLIPVIARQSRDLLDVLARTPARRWIVTGSTTGLAKRTSILRREQGVLRRFLADAGREVREEFVFGEEFGYVVE